VIGSGGGDLVFNANTLSNAHPGIATGGGGVTLHGGTAGTTSMALSNNSFRDAHGNAVLIVKDPGTGSISGSFSANTVGVAATANSGSLEGSGLSLEQQGKGSMTMTVANNQVRQYNNWGVVLIAGGGIADSGNLNVSLAGNTIANPGTNAAIGTQFQGLHINSGVTPGDTFQTCLDIGAGNTITNSGRNAGTDFRFRQRQSTTVKLPGYAGAAGDDAAVVAFVQSRMSGASTGAAISDFPTTGGGFTGGASCP